MLSSDPGQSLNVNVPFISLMCVEVGEAGKGSEVVVILAFVWKTCAKKICMCTHRKQEIRCKLSTWNSQYCALLHDWPYYGKTCKEFCFFLDIWVQWNKCVSPDQNRCSVFTFNACQNFQWFSLHIPNATFLYLWQS